MRKCLRTATIVAIVVLLAAAIAAAVVAVSPSASGASPGPDPVAKNVILFIGDGMGPQEMQLGRSLNGGQLMLDGIPWGGEMMIDTTSLDGVTDSAAGATALATGEETWNGWLSMGPPVVNGDPTIFTPTVLELAEDLDKATGLVTTAEIAAATPAAFGAHVPDRDLDEEITRQMAEQGIEALFSGSWSEDYLLDGLADVYVSKLKELTPYLRSGDWPESMYGFFGHMAYPLDFDEEEVVKKQPTLAQMTSAAIGVLEQDDDGFFLMVEQATIDYGGHSRDPGWVGADVNDLDLAVMAAYDWARQPGHDDTLIVVTADHETGGLGLTSRTDYRAIKRQTATTEWMWGLIKRSPTGQTVTDVLEEYAGFTPTAGEQRLILRNKEMGISDVLAARDKVTWGWSGTDEGDHTATPVEVRAWGPGADAFNDSGIPDNEVIGKKLLIAVDN